ncbi:MAG: HAD-IA family hydrolase [Sphingomonadales bacterium]|nr:HAD-IA family hydrolase [Sphingomonadales bacterium]
MRLAVFDCDGTLIDGQADICTAMEQAFGEVGLVAPERSLIRRAVGLSLPQAVRTLLPEGERELQTELVERYKHAFRAARVEGRLTEPLYDGIRLLLDSLLERGWLLGVATGKSQRGLVHCLAGHGLSGHFVTLQTADHHPSKPHPAMLEAALADALAAPGDAVMIGDTAYDIHMAQAAGVRALGVAWGYHAPEELFAAGADAVATTPAQLGALLQ